MGQGACLGRGIYPQLSREADLFVSPRGALNSAAINLSPAWKSLGSAETPGPLPGWTMTSSSAKPQGLGWPSEPASPAVLFLEATECPWRWEEDLE